MNNLNTKVDNAVQKAFRKMDKVVEDDLEILEHNIRKRVIERLKTNFTDDIELLAIMTAQESVIFLDTLCKAYINTVIQEVVPIIKADILKDISKKNSLD